jgi:hypothetical protein
MLHLTQEKFEKCSGNLALLRTDPTKLKFLHEQPEGETLLEPAATLGGSSSTAHRSDTKHSNGWHPSNPTISSQKTHHRQTRTITRRTCRTEVISSAHFTDTEQPNAWQTLSTSTNSSYPSNPAISSQKTRPQTDKNDHFHLK